MAHLEIADLPIRPIVVLHSEVLVMGYSSCNLRTIARKVQQELIVRLSLKRVQTLQCLLIVVKVTTLVSRLSKHRCC